MNYRKDFPLFKTHPELVYLDSAATSQKPKIVLDAITDYYCNYNANVRRGLYALAEKATSKVEEVRKQVAQFINAKDFSEIVFVRNATEGINLVMNCLDDGSFDAKSSIVTTILEHHSNFVPWQFLAQMRQSEFVVIDFDEKFDLQFDWYDFKNTKVVALTHISNVLGTINPIKKIIKKIRAKNGKVKIIIDAAQSLPHIKIDVQDLDCDFLVFSGHKMFAATGIGVLYGKKNLFEGMSPFLFGGDMIEEVAIEKTTLAKPPYKFEAGTPDIAGIVSLGAAIEYINSIGISSIAHHEEMLIKYCATEMKRIEEVEIIGPSDGTKRTSIISFVMKGIHPHDIAQILGDKMICIRAGHHCAMPLHDRLEINATARISFSIYNDQNDIDLFIDGLKKVKKIFRS